MNTPDDKALRDRRDRLAFRRYADTGDPAIRRELIERFLPLAKALAGRYSGGSEPHEDLLQVAYEGLVRAFDGYDPSRGTSFVSYAAPSILGTLRHHFRDRTRAVRVPRSIQENMARVRAEIDAFHSDEGRSPRPEEIAERTGMSAESVLEALEAEVTHRPRSLDQPSGGDEHDDPQPLAARIPSVELGFDKVEAQLAMSAVGLTRQEEQILNLRFEHGMTQREIGARVGVSQMQVSRILRRSLDKLLEAVQGKQVVTA